MLRNTPKTSAIGTGWLGYAILLLIGCQPSNTYQPPPLPEVIVSRPVRMSVSNYLEATGTTAAIESVQIRARVDGFLDAINFEPGQYVDEGQLLYEIDPRPYEAQLNLALATREVSKAEFRDAQAKYQRVIPLAESGAVSQEDLVERRAAQDVYRAKIDASDAAVEEAQLNLGYSKVHAPIEGRVGKTLITVGNYVGGMNATHLTTVVRYDPIFANFNINELDLLSIREPMPKDERNERRDVTQVRIYLQLANESGFPHLGRGDYAELGLDEGTGTYSVRAIFPNPSLSILPGMFVRIRIPYGIIEDAILLPEKVVSIDQLGRYVLVIGDDGKVERRDIEIGIKVVDMVVVKAGLEGDEQVVIEGIQRARPGSKVVTQEQPIEPPVIPEDERLDMNAPLPEIEGPTRRSGAIVADDPLSESAAENPATEPPPLQPLEPLSDTDTNAVPPNPSGTNNN